MKLKYIKYAVIAFILVGCTDLDDDYFDTVPESIFPENERQAAMVSAPAYKALEGFLDWGGWFFCQEVTADAVTVPVRETDWKDGGKWVDLHQHTWTNTTEAVSAMWGAYYEGVAKSNQIIEIYEAAPESELGNISIAKMKALRAFYYYLLIDNYGDVPYVTSFSNAEQKPTKEKRAVVFNKIVNELEEAVKILPDSKVKTAVSKGMIFSVLAKLYLNAEVYTGTAEWLKAKNACDSVIKLGYDLDAKPLDPFVVNNENSIENIFTIPFHETNKKGFNLHMRTLHYQHNLTYEMTVGPWNGFSAMESHYNTYEDKDLRKKGFIVGPQYDVSGKPLFDKVADAEVVIDPNIPALEMDASFTKKQVRFTGARVGKFEIEMGATDNMNNDFPLFRFADILLMKAEALIRLGAAGDGDSEINLVRKRAGLDELTGITLTQLLEERGREMFWEGHRRQDLIRFGEYNKAWWEKEISSTDRNVFPVPQWAIDSNPNLQ